MEQDIQVKHRSHEEKGRNCFKKERDERFYSLTLFFNQGVIMIT